MNAAVHYPDLAVPPTGWTYIQAGTQMRLSPPKTGAQGDKPAGVATIIVSPLIPRHSSLPPIEKLIALALEAEEKLGFQVSEQSGPTPLSTTTGLHGYFYEVRGFVRPGAPVERRIYVMYADELCYYGINYVADEATYDTHVELFWKVAKSVKPFQGRVNPAGSGGEGPHGSYKD